MQIFFFLQENAKDFEDCRWYECCAFYGFREYVISAAEDEDNVKLIPSIVEKVILPKLTGKRREREREKDL